MLVFVAEDLLKLSLHFLLKGDPMAKADFSERDDIVLFLAISSEGG
jgi:hypothetical protein